MPAPLGTAVHDDGDERSEAAQRRFRACQVSLNMTSIFRTGCRVTPSINVYTWISSTCKTIGSTDVTSAADTPHDARILFIEVGNGIV